MYLDAAGAVLVAALAGHHHSVTVAPGDTLSAIAARPGVCGNAADYPGLAAASGITDPDRIAPGQQVTVNCATAGPRSHWKPARTVAYTIPAVPAYHGRHAAPAQRDPFDGHHGQCGDGDGDGMDADCAVIFPHRYGGQARSGYQQAATSYTGRHRAGRSYRASSGGGSSYHGSPGCQAHIIADESGGNPQAVNGSSGAGGLYQFLPSTWRALGHSGLPQNASVAEQNQAFQQQVAQSGYSAWAASGGCG